MAIGTTLGIIALGTAIAGTTVAAVGSVKAGNAAQRAANYNAAAMDAQAADALVRGRQDASTFRTEVRRLIGTQRAQFAGQNVEVGSGSALDVQADSAYLGELDAQQIEANAAREAWGYSSMAESERMGGRAAASAGRWGAASTALGGGGSLLMTAYGWQRIGGRR